MDAKWALATAAALTFVLAWAWWDWAWVYYTICKAERAERRGDRQGHQRCLDRLTRFLNER